MDIDKNGEEEFVVGGFYMNNYYVKNKQRYAYGWKVLGLNGKDLTTQFFKDNGIDRGTDLFPLGLDIDETAEGIEMIPGTWGLELKNYIDGSPSLGYYYKNVNGKFEKTVIFYFQQLCHIFLLIYYILFYFLFLLPLPLEVNLILFVFLFQIVFDNLHPLKYLSLGV
jgi:hypothetical protein